MRLTNRALWQSRTEARKARSMGRRRWFSLFSSTALGSITRFLAVGGGGEGGRVEEAAAGPLVLGAGDPRGVRLRSAVFS